MLPALPRNLAQRAMIVFLLGVFEKAVRLTWFFDCEVVVSCW
jgi:hypothetical protein